jgi:hypothetical protein
MACTHAPGPDASGAEGDCFDRLAKAVAARGTWSGVLAQGAALEFVTMRTDPFVAGRSVDGEITGN